MGFLQATKIIAENTIKESKSFTFAASCQLDKIDIFLKAHFINQGYNANYDLLPYNTFPQYLINSNNTNHIVLIFPWDLCPALNWRLGNQNINTNIAQLEKEASTNIDLICQLSNATILYCDTDVPPVLLKSNESSILKNKLINICLKNNINIISNEYFSLNSYISNGCPIISNKLSSLASLITSLFLKNSEPKKIIVTDFDNVMWNGVIGEDGLDNISYDQSTKGYKHYIYQSCLKRLVNSGIILTGVTRNDEKLASLAFSDRNMILTESDFVCVIASYNAKSSQISMISRQLNLPLESFIFIDDNPVELEEVMLSLPEVKCLLFPKAADNLPDFINRLFNNFNLDTITDDDKNRTEFYKKRSLSISSSKKQGANLDEYLISLKMKINTKVCSQDKSARAIQLINKTNQFNANGIRISEQHIKERLSDNLLLLSFSLTDNHGNHGEIASVLIENKNKILNFVLSCRAFQRNIEYYVLHWIHKELSIDSLCLDYINTERNEPLRIFLSTITGKQVTADGQVNLDLNKICSQNRRIDEIFSETD